jgi:hypothetical protein
MIVSDISTNNDTTQDFDLYIADSNSAGYFRLSDAYISSPRRDNLSRKGQRLSAGFHRQE